LLTPPPNLPPQGGGIETELGGIWKIIRMGLGLKCFQNGH